MNDASTGQSTQPQNPPPADNNAGNQPPEHERRKRGFHGLGASDKTPYRSGINSQLPGALHGDVDARVLLSKETPAQRRMVELAIQGFTIKETSSLLGVTRVTVKNTLRQPWAREYMINSMKQSTVDEVSALLKSELLPSLQKLIAVRDSESTRPETVAQVSNSIIDRVLGRAAQPILSGKLDPKNLTDDELATLAGRGHEPALVTPCNGSTASSAGTTSPSRN